MGSASSVTLTSAEARIRLGEAECNRFDEGFKRIVPGLEHGAISLSLFTSTFIAELSPTCPRAMAPAIFRAFNLSNSGAITQNEFLVGLCVVRCGTLEERLELVFNAADASRNGLLDEFELKSYLALLDDQSLQAHSDRLFARRASVTMKEWVEWAQECFGDASSLLSWVVELDRALGGRAPLPPSAANSPVAPPGVLRPRKWGIDGTPPPSPQFAPTFRNPPASPLLSAMPALGRSRSSSWAMQAPGSPQQQGIDFSHEGLGSLKALFNRCREQSASGAVDLAALQAAFAQSKSTVPPTLVEAIFERLDDNGDGAVDVRDFVGGLCCCFGGSVEDKLEFCFSLFAHGNSSSGGKSVLDRKGMGLLIKSLWSVEDIHLACARDTMTVEGSVISGDGDWLDLRLPPPALVLERETSSSPEVLAGIDALVGRAMADFGGGGDDALLTLRQFTAWAQRAGSSGKGVELSSSLTERLERATFVDIGIVPPDPATELRLVHGMAKAARIPVFDPAAPGPVGTVWCVVEKGWLDSWCDSVGISSFQQILQPAESLVAAPSIPPPQKRLRKYLPPLDNRALVDSWGQLLPTVFYREQYELIGAEVARILTAWYGDSTGGPIERLVIDAAQDGDVERENETADAVPSSVLEVFPPLVTVTLESEETVGFPTIRCWIASAADPLSTAVLQEAKERFALSDSDEARLWYNNPTNGVWGLVDDQREPKKMEDDGNDDFGDHNAGDRLDSPPPLPRPLTLGVLCAGEQQPQFLLEVRSGPRGSWPRGGPQEAGSPRQQGVVSPMVTSPVSASPVKRARVEAAYVLCGLSNLGNTCYLNSVLQALRHTRLFRDYFAELHRHASTTDPSSQLPSDPFGASEGLPASSSGNRTPRAGLGLDGNELVLPYQYDLNLSSKWGARGKLAVALSDLFLDMNAAETEAEAKDGRDTANVPSATVRPSGMKTQLAAFDSMFAGYEQQDASEALAKILEGVGEDVNRIGGAEKPYTELPDSAGRADKEVASEWWAAHEAREKHVVTALMTGQLKVTTTCSATQVASTTFEQFVSLAVPLPEDNRLFFTVVVVFSTATTTAALPTLEAAGCDTPIAPSSSAASLPLSTSPVSNRRPLRCAVAVPQDGTVATLLAEIANLLNGRPGGGRGGDSETAEGMVAAYVGTDHFITSVLPADKALALLHPDALLHVFRVGIPPLPVPPPPLVEGDKVEIWSGLSWREAVVSRGPVKVLLKEGEQSLDRAGERIERGPAQDVGAPLVQSIIERKEEDEEVECRDENGMVWTASVSLGSVRRLRDTPVLLLMCLRVQVSVARFFVDPHRLELFGRPFVLRVVPDLTTGRDLYSSVWAHVGQLFDMLEELPESNGRFKFRVRRVSKGHTIGPDGSLAGDQGTGAGAVAGGLNPLLVPGGQVIPADVVPLRVQDEEVLLVDVPAEWLACFNRRAAAYVEEDASISQLNEERCRPVNLVQCLRSLCEPEEVTAFSPALTRMRGGEYSESKQSKCSQLWHPPPVLVIVLKRFRLTPSGAKHKLSTPVVFPLEGLDFAEFMDSSRVSKEVRHGDAVYDLAAVVNHIGSLGGGHYTCFAKRHRRRRDGEGSDGQSYQETHSEPAWALFDDSRVATVDDLDRIISPQAYVLVYELRKMSSKQLKDVYAAPSESTPIDPATVRRAAWQPPSIAAGAAYARQKGYGVPAYVTTFFDVSGPDFFDWISSPVIGGILAASAAALVNWVFFQARVLFGANRNHG